MYGSDWGLAKLDWGLAKLASPEICVSECTKGKQQYISLQKIGVMFICTSVVFDCCNSLIKSIFYAFTKNSVLKTPLLKTPLFFSGIAIKPHRQNVKGH